MTSHELTKTHVTPPLEIAGATSTPQAVEVSSAMLELLYRELVGSVKAVARARGMEIRIVVTTATRPDGNTPH